MRNYKSPLTLGLLAICVFLINLPVFQYPLGSVWEPRLALAHILIVLIVFVLLSRRLSLAGAFIGALLFGIFPTHVHTLASGIFDAKALAWYVLVLGLAVGFAVGVEQFHKFLRNQEPLIRYLFWAGIYALIVGLALLVSFQANQIFVGEESLLRWRTQQGRDADACLKLAELLRRDHAVARNPAKVNTIVDLYNNAIALSPQLMKAYDGLAEFYLTAGRRQEALEVYQRALAMDTARRETYYRLGALYEDMDQPKWVIEIYNMLLKLYPEDDEVCVRVMDAYRRAIHDHPQTIVYQEKREELLSRYEELSKRKKYTAADYFNLGFLYEQVGGYEEAVRFYRKALQLQPTHEQALYNLANRFQQAGDFKAALLLYERMVRLHPKSPMAYLNMGIILNSLGDAPRARYFYQKTIGLDPKNAEAYFNLGYLNENGGELREALNDYEKAVENNPKHAEAYYNMGNVYATLGQYPEAIASYLKTVGINANHQSAYVNLSILSFKSGNFREAIRYLEEARLLGYNPPEEYLQTLEGYRKK